MLNEQSGISQGLGTTAVFVIEALASSDHSCFLYSPKKPSADIPMPSNVIFRHPRPGQWGGFWRSRGILEDLMRDRIDLFHGLSNELPVGIKSSKIKSVVTIHDLIFLRYPQYYPWVDRAIYKLKFRYACQHADRIIAISEQTKKDIISFFGIPESRIEVVYQDCNNLFKKQYESHQKMAVKARYNLPGEYLLNVGTIEDRKNLLLVVQALRALPPEISLVVVGKDTPYARLVKKYVQEQNLSERVHFLKNVAYTDLPLIYQQARIFVYPSRFEGFGIPIIEALHSGVPVIAATGSCLEEAGGPGSIYIDPDNVNGLTDIIRMLWTDESQRSGMIISGMEHVRQFSSERIARRLTDIYTQVLTC
jgi:glycosyltransferase involved in cell wall biosynthesis